MIAVEIGMHTAPINMIDVDRDERFLVSGSDDKTIRVWNLETGDLLRTIRVPISTGDAGTIYAVAISPDGRLIAAAGRTSEVGAPQTIYILELATAKLKARVGNFRNAVVKLAFSHDARFLAAVLGGVEKEYGVRFYETESFSEIARDEYKDQAYGLDFAPDGRVATSSWDGLIRLYNQHFELETKAQAPSGGRPWDLSFSPDGHEIALGYLDTTSVDILSTKDLTLLFNADTQGISNGGLFGVAWSTDGDRLCAGGTYTDETGAVPLRCWGARGKGAFEDLTFGTANTIMTLKALREGKLAVATADPMLGVFDEQGKVRWAHRGEIADFRHQMRVSDSGDVVAFGFEQSGKRPARFSLRAGQLELDPAPNEGLRGARTEGPGIDIESWANSHEPTFNGKLLALEPGEYSFSLDIAPNNDRFVLGTEWSLRAFDSDGRQLWETSTGQVVWSVTITGDGRTAVAGLSDGTIRWYDMADGRELLAFFPHADGKRWVAWMPEGFFAASEGGEDLIGYHLNRGADELPDFVRLEQLFERYYRPDLLVQRLARNEAPIRAALGEVGSVDALLEASRPPTIELVGPAVERIGYSRFIHEMLLGDEGSGVGKVVYRVNGVLIEQVDTRAEISHRGDGRIVRKQPLDLKQGRNEIEARALTPDGKLASAPVVQVIEVDDWHARPPALYGIAVGIDAYFDSALALNYAANDARTFKQTLESVGAPLFTKVDIRLLPDQDATISGITDAFHALAGIVDPNDVFVLYLSGHGFAEDGRYYFIPQELSYTDHEALVKGSLSGEALIGLLTSIKAQKSLVILDTCFAGAALNTPQLFAMLPRGLEEKSAIDRLMRATGRAFLAATTDVDLALEGYKGHGLYTYALLEGLRGDADLKAAGNHDGNVTVDELSQYLEQRVPSLSLEAFKRTQVPMRYLAGQSFPVAVDEQK
jgi:WD40 repeat protein